MLVSARRIGVPRKTERSDVLWGESLADLFKTSIRLSAKVVFCVILEKERIKTLPMSRRRYVRWGKM